MAAVGERSRLIQTFGRLSMLVFWALVLWGVLLFLSTFANAVREGPAAAFARLVPAHGASPWGWLALVSMVLALGVGLTVGAAVVRKRAVRAEEP
jgi:hypothetical protein